MSYAGSVFLIGPVCFDINVFQTAYWLNSALAHSPWIARRALERETNGNGKRGKDLTQHRYPTVNHIN